MARRIWRRYWMRKGLTLIIDGLIICLDNPVGTYGHASGKLMQKLGYWVVLIGNAF